MRWLWCSVVGVIVRCRLVMISFSMRYSIVMSRLFASIWLKWCWLKFRLISMFSLLLVISVVRDVVVYICMIVVCRFVVMSGMVRGSLMLCSIC